MAYVYAAVKDPFDGKTKVGFSKNPEERVLALRTQFKAKIKLAAKVSCDGYNPYSIEQQVHSILKRQKLHDEGEWFNVSPQIALWAIYRGKKRYARRYRENGRFKIDRRRFEPVENMTLFYNKASGYQWLGYWSDRYGGN
jgi:hypothetical protein